MKPAQTEVFSIPLRTGSSTRVRTRRGNERETLDLFLVKLLDKQILRRLPCTRLTSGRIH